MKNGEVSMIKSMTGYGRAQKTMDGRDITVELRSVNHRFFECSVRGPRSLGYLEEKLKTALSGVISRGKVDVNVTVVTVEGGTTKVQINHDLARAYLDSLRELAADLGVQDDIRLSSLSRFSDIFIVRKAEEDADEIWNAVSAVFQEAAAGFVAMREAEGAKLREDVLMRLALIESYVGQVEELSPKAAEEYRARLQQKLTDILCDRQIDEARLITEAAIFAEKTAVAEETVRLQSHIGQLREFLESAEPVGRKLDFLVQELNREANTIGSKGQDVAIARIVVEIKSEIEKIREQIQNIE
jgi:uncharacterized protein (TIGR00255 family)